MSDTSGPERVPAAEATALEADDMQMLQDAVLRRLAAARERVEHAAQLLAEGDWGRDASAELQRAIRALQEDQEGRPDPGR